MVLKIIEFSEYLNYSLGWEIIFTGLDWESYFEYLMIKNMKKGKYICIKYDFIDYYWIKENFNFFNKVIQTINKDFYKKANFYYFDCNFIIKNNNMYEEGCSLYDVNCINEKLMSLVYKNENYYNVIYFNLIDTLYYNIYENQEQIFWKSFKLFLHFVKSKPNFLLIVGFVDYKFIEDYLYCFEEIKCFSSLYK